MLVGVFIAIVVELCGIKALSFAIGLYLPLATTLPIFIGGAIRGLVDWQQKRKGEYIAPEEEDLGKGNLFATGLVAGGAIAGVIVAFLSVNGTVAKALTKINLEEALSSMLGGALGYEILGVLFFAALGLLLYRVARSEK